MVDVRTQLTTLAIEEVENGDFIMATRLLTTAIRLNPNNPELYFDRSICHYKLGDHQASLDDANAAIRLNSTDYNIHYQKGLALLGLGLVNEGIISFKKAIELRAIQDDSKLSHIFYLLRDAVKEVDAAKARLGLNKNPKTTGKTVVQASPRPDMVLAKDNGETTTTTTTTNHHHHHNLHQVGISNTDPVDSTTDRTPVSLLMDPSAASATTTAAATTPSFNNRGLGSLETCLRNTGNNSLVAAKRNSNSSIIINNQQPIQAQLINGPGGVGVAGASTNTTCLVNNVGAVGSGSLMNQNRVSSSANHIINNNNSHHNNIISNRHLSTLQMTTATTSAAVNVLPGTMSAIMNPSVINPASNMDLMGVTNQQVDEAKAAQFAWNIRRSERIFLHHTEPGPPGTSTSSAGALQYSLMQQQPVPSSSAIVPPPSLRHRLPIANGCDTNKGPNKRSYESLNEPTFTNQQSYQNQVGKLKEGPNSIVESEIDVDDSTTTIATNLNLPINDSNVGKRVMIAPSSSMPATSLVPSTSSSSAATTATKDDSYSSKYKRARRDRERARRGTSKLCTIKSSDLEELYKPSESPNSSRRSMRVIAPIDGWLYSGELSVDNSLGNNGAPQFVVKLDGDATSSSYLFSQSTVLNDVIKEVRVKTVSELRKGARICCYWSRQYKCLSTGVVTSRTFEATKSLVSVKYDNGDLSALPLDDLRLLPPDYPKYMSNCDPLLLARNGDGVAPQQQQQTNTTVVNAMPIKNIANVNQNGARVVITENKVLSPQHPQVPTHQQQLQQQQLLPTPSCRENSPSKLTNAVLPQDNKYNFVNLADKSQPTIENTKTISEPEPSVSPEERPLEVDESYVAEQDATTDFDCQLETQVQDKSLVEDDDEDDEDATIPTTDETIDFITSESSIKLEIDEEHCSRENDVDNDDDATDEDPSLAEEATNSMMKTITKESMNIVASTETSSQQQDSNNANSRASSEENNYGMTYCPWLFVGSPKRNKKHGRAYRDYYTSIRRGNEIIKVGDSAELMPRDQSILPFIAKIDGFWATARGEMRVRVRWYYRLIETEGEPHEMPDGDNALFETDHLDENDVQSIYRSTKILSWTDYNKDNLGHVNKSNDNAPKIFYLAGYYDPVKRTKHLRPDIKKAL